MRGKLDKYFNSIIQDMNSKIQEVAMGIPCGAKEIRGINTSDLRQTVMIDPVDHGFIVSVGCKRIAIEDPDKVCKLLSLFLKDPKNTTKQFLSGGLAAIKKVEPEDPDH